MNDNSEDIIPIPIDGTLDLHTFNPREVTELLNDYIDACLEAGIFEIQIIHGKGKGILRDRVHSILKRHARVKNFSLDPGASGWGATVVVLKKQIQL
jgi:dsDNA-specific endonuclease/ATPase MutS2